MSGIYIKGMEMPKAGGWKTIRIFYEGTCAVPNWQGDCTLMKGCEAIPVPDHGQLIDADAPIEVLDVQFPSGKTTVSKLLLSKIFGKIPPTIIPADKEVEG